MTSEAIAEKNVFQGTLDAAHLEQKVKAPGI